MVSRIRVKFTYVYYFFSMTFHLLLVGHLFVRFIQMLLSFLNFCVISRQRLDVARNSMLNTLKT